MNSRISTLIVLGACLGLAGCATTGQYPATYEIPFSPTQVRNDFGPPNLIVNGVQDVYAHPGSLLYFQVVSPANIIFYAFDKTGPNPGGPILTQLQGTSFYGSVVPTGEMVEFVVSSTQPAPSGAVQLTVSDSPMAAGAGIPPYSAPMGALAPQPPVFFSPPSASIVTGQSVNFTVSGGAGTGAFVWAGAAPATGLSNTYTFYAPGTYTISVYRSADGSYATSNRAEAVVTVLPPATPMPAPASPVVVTPGH